MATPNVELKLDNPQEIQAALESHIRSTIDAFTPEQRSLLSNVLFPETHGQPISVLGKERTLRPLTIKISRKFSELLAPLNQEFQSVASDPNSTVLMDNKIVQGLISCILVLCDYYGDDWNDIRKSIEAEDINIADLQNIAMQQQLVQGTNDFLLVHLRIILQVMQSVELMSVRQRVTMSKNS